MGFRQVFRNNITTTFLDFLLFSDNSDAAAARAGSGLNDVHVLPLGYFSVDEPPFVVLGENVRHWSYIIRFRSENTLHPLDIAPHKILPTDSPTSWEMISLLKLVGILNLRSFK